MTHYLISGTLLGLFAGFSPGPLLTLVITETLTHNVKSGFKVAVAPAITDIPIVLLTLFLLSKLTHFHTVLGIISIVGGLLVLYFGYECIRSKGINLQDTEQKPHSLRKGVIVNLLSPHPYLFWFSVGAPILLKAGNVGFSAAAGFILCIYCMLMGSKIAIAVLTGKSRSFLTGNLYLFTLRSLGLCLFVFAVFLFRDGVNLIQM